MNKLPTRFKQEIPEDIALSKMRIFSEFNIKTVCKEAKCPNLSNCFKKTRLTFIILGDTCTRNCRFCNINKSKSAQEPSLGVDLDEPQRIVEVVKELGMNYVVITSVTRDDLKDGGATQFAKIVELIHGINRDIKIELLIPDFQGKISSLKCVLDAQPDVVGHNIETVSRLYKDLRPEARYQLSLNLLSKIKELNPSVITKSSIMLGFGERQEEVINTMEDLRYNQCDILILGQYLAPSTNHYPVREFIDIEQFQEYENLGIALGFKAVLSGPLVRSSYRAEEVYREVMYA